MVIDGLRRNVQPVGKLGVGMSLDEQRKNLDFARRKAGRVLTR